MHYVYVLKSKANKSLYIGKTNDLKRRLLEHNSGQSPSTARYQPWIYVYVEAYRSEDDAKLCERRLKGFGRAYGQLKRRIANSLNDA
ncbi:MAG: GIY-YIG nuclease family protein [Patescibacteria group bacterium]|nr:GIY-YIG nuclease family protein [Patescibacteria group bacterium]MDE2438302.1 GIY-YIG nuclease family protein [Patescibacteria group bacterium]